MHLEYDNIIEHKSFENKLGVKMLLISITKRYNSIQLSSQLPAKSIM